MHEQYRKLSPQQLLLVRGGRGAVAQVGGWYIGHRHGVLRYRHSGWLRAGPLQVVPTPAECAPLTHPECLVWSYGPADTLLLLGVQTTHFDMLWQANLKNTLSQECVFLWSRRARKNTLLPIVWFKTHSWQRVCFTTHSWQECFKTHYWQ